MRSLLRRDDKTTEDVSINYKNIVPIANER